MAVASSASASSSRAPSVRSVGARSLARAHRYHRSSQRAMLPKAERIRAAAKQDCCPERGDARGRTPEEDRRVGTGSVADGALCGLKCLSAFHSEQYSERIDRGLPSPN